MRIPRFVSSAIIKDRIKLLAWRLDFDRKSRRHSGFVFNAPDAEVRERQVILVHIPKTGGISLGNALYGRSPTHRTWEEWQSFHPDQFADYLKIAIVRDPTSRFLSAYDYLLSGGRNEMDRAFAALFIRPSGHVNALIARLDRRPRFRRKIMSFIHFRPQVDYVTSVDGTIMVNRLIPFPRMNEEVPRLLGISELPRLNATPGRRTPTSFLNPLSLHVLRSLYARDYALYDSASSHGSDVFGSRCGTDLSALGF